jgi:hypothetical protein
MTKAGSTPDTPVVRRPYRAEIEREHKCWYELVRLVRSLTPEECLEPGYHRDPDWAVRDVIAHLGTWLAEAQVQLERIGAGTYEGHDVDVDALDAVLLEGMEGQPWEVTWVQAQAARTWMLEVWDALREPSDEAAWWIRKGAAEHYAGHLDRLQEWTEELIARRPTGNAT